MRTENHTVAGGRSVAATLHFSRKELKITQTPFGAVIKLADFKNSGEPGAPALPVTQLRLAVPQPLWPGSLKIVTDKWESVSEPLTLVVPVQPLRAGGGEHGDGKGLHCSRDCSCRQPVRPDHAPVAEEPLPSPKAVPPNENAYVDAIKNPPPVVSAVGLETIGSTNIAVIEIAPIRISPKGELQLCTQVRVEVDTLEKPCLIDRDEAVAEFKKLYGKDFDPKRVVTPPEPFISGLAEATRLRDIAISSVINPAIIGPIIRRDWPIIELRSDYLIITDDVTWDPVTITPVDPRPGMIAAFERLAQAKRARGISTRVVSITNIVAGNWGDVRTGSRDLQEVIRRFLKLVRRRWGVSWLLLGGDVSIVPVRQVGGSTLGRVEPPSTTNPPEPKNSFWTGAHLRIHARDLGEWWGGSDRNLLTRQDTGALIPYDATGNSSSTVPGWYFTTANDYRTRTTAVTNFVRVEGPESLVNGPMRFLYAWNTLPTDFYYASLSSWVIRHRVYGRGIVSFRVPYVYTPPHDWDASGNGIYGQFSIDGRDLDGVLFQTDLSVGRAPVESATEANTFIDKTLAYERLGAIFWRSPNRNWPRKMLLASGDWADRLVFRSTANNPPAAEQYYHDLPNTRSMLRLKTTPENFDWRLIARMSDTDRRILPLKRDPSSAVRGWYFATSGTDATPSERRLSLPWGPISWPIPSEWIVVHSSIAERTPALYEFNSTGQDGSMRDQEALRAQIKTELPGIDRFDRYYEDEFDLTAAERLDAPVDFLSQANLISGLNAAPAIVSLSGHGSSNGCCRLSRAVAGSLTNGFPGFVAYADSCLTSSFEVDDAMGEELIKNPNGGAVAYVGNTRFSWIGVGDDFQRAFFSRLAATRHLGLLNDSRTTAMATRGTGRAFNARWQVFTLNLLGDPELRVYRRALPPLILRPGIVRLRVPQIRVIIDRRVPIGPPIPGDPEPVRGALVYIRQGKTEFTGSTDADGFIRLPEGKFQKGELEVTASHDDFAVATQRYQVEDDRPAPKQL